MKLDKDIFENMPVPKAILKSAVPTIIGMVVVLVYNIADTYFVGQTGDPMQVAAVSLTMPVFLLFMAMGNLIGIGGTSVISRALGSGKIDYAAKVSSFCFYASLGSGLFMTVLFWGAMPLLLRLIGASSETASFAREYLLYIAPSAPFVVISTVFNNVLRAEGKSSQAMHGMMIGTIVNIILDPLMILVLDMGVAGAALATLIGNIAGSIYYIHYVLRKSAILSVSPGKFDFRDGIMTGVMAIGIPAALNNVLMSTSNIILNNFLAGYGDIQVAAMGVAMKVSMVVVLLQIGLGVGIQPLLGYSFGARDHRRFNSLILVSLLYAILMGVVLTSFCWFTAGSTVKAFIDSPEVFAFGVDFLKALLVSGPVIGILFVFMNILQAVGAAKESLVLSVSRQGLVFLPLLFLLNRTMGLTGIVYAQPLADIFSIILSGFLFVRINRRLWKKEETKEMRARVS